jgi:hypothetical protein
VDPESRSDFALSEAAKVGQLDGLLLLCGQGGQRRTDFRSAQPGMSGLGCGVMINRGLLPVINRIPGYRRPGCPDPVHRSSVHDRYQEGESHSLLRVEPSGRPPQIQVCLLSDFLGKRSVGHHPQGEAVRRCGSGVVELAKRLRIAARGSFEQHCQVKLMGSMRACAG